MLLSPSVARSELHFSEITQPSFVLARTFFVENQLLPDRRHRRHFSWGQTKGPKEPKGDGLEVHLFSMSFDVVLSKFLSNSDLTLPSLIQWFQAVSSHI